MDEQSSPWWLLHHQDDLSPYRCIKRLGRYVLSCACGKCPVMTTVPTRGHGQADRRRRCYAASASSGSAFVVVPAVWRASGEHGSLPPPRRPESNPLHPLGLYARVRGFYGSNWQGALGRWRLSGSWRCGSAATALASGRARAWRHARRWRGACRRACGPARARARP
jgi:hypothetical protein